VRQFLPPLPFLTVSSLRSKSRSCTLKRNASISRSPLPYSHPTSHGPTFAHTLSFVDLEVLVLVDHGGASPREVADCLGMDLVETKALFHDLVQRGLLTGQDESTTFQLTPLAQVPRKDEAFSSAAFAAALTGARSNDQG
jgi:hypothetical protein